jgi:hypothetical protein
MSRGRTASKENDAQMGLVVPPHALDDSSIVPVHMYSLEDRMKADRAGIKGARASPARCPNGQAK